MAGEGSTSTGSAIDLNAPEIVAVVNDRVARETAELRTRAEQAEARATESQTRIDVLEAQVTTAEQARQAAETERDTLRTEVEAERASAQNREARQASLREVAAHLTDAWFQQAAGEGQPTRLDRIARMSDDEFTAYRAEIASAFEGVTVAPAQGGTSTGQPPRETAMASGAAAGNGNQGGSTAKPRASKSFLGTVRAY